MTKNNGASIREVYTITQRLEDKIDALDRRMSRIEGKASILAVVWSSAISLVGIFVGYFWIKK